MKILLNSRLIRAVKFIRKDCVEITKITMNIDKIKTGDIVIFEQGKHMLHGKVTSIGCRFDAKPFRNMDEQVLFVKVFEYPEWKELTLRAKEVKDVIIIPEKVHFT